MNSTKHALVAGILFIGTVGLTCKIGGNGAGVVSRSPNDSTQSLRQLVDGREASGLTRRQLAGKLVYTKYCQVCHGVEGDGKGFNAFNLQNSFGVQPASFADSSFQTTHDEQSMTNVVSKGAKAIGKSQYMPPWSGTLTEEEIESVVLYVETISKSRK